MTSGKGKGKRHPKGLLAAAVLLSLVAFGAHAESVYVKYRGEIDLAPFNCHGVKRSSVIQRVCYDSREKYLLLSLAGTYYHYCEVDRATVSYLLSAESMGRYYNRQIKGRFDCRVKRMPAYKK